MTARAMASARSFPGRRQGQYHGEVGQCQAGARLRSPARDLAGKLVHNVVFGPIGEIMNENDHPRLSAKQCLHATGHPEAAVNQASIHIRRGEP